MRLQGAFGDSQVIDHAESTVQQYRFVERAIALEWTPDRVIVIDEEQGQSGQSS